MSDIAIGILIGIPLGMALLYGLVLLAVYVGFNYDWKTSRLRWWKR